MILCHPLWCLRIGFWNKIFHIELLLLPQPLPAAAPTNPPNLIYFCLVAIVACIWGIEFPLPHTVWILLPRPTLLRTLPVMALRPPAAYKYRQSFGKSCLKFLCVHNRLGLGFFTQSHCLSKACPMPVQDVAVGFFLPKCMTYVWKCKRTYSSVAWCMRGLARERAAA